ncbi:hypothetical protein F5X97DRAFT_344557 [Nemania serpens]|nr:hypothetical protein F5X97DRAFT_344557 [Nemania serpens]
MCQPLSKAVGHEETETDFSTLFNRLPPELRQLVWKEAALTSMDNPELLILLPGWLSNGIHSLDMLSPFPPVNTSFPSVMHVNREARQTALRHVDMADLGPYPWDKCLVPQRPFRPEIDILYAGHSMDPFRDFNQEEVLKVQHLALDYGNYGTTNRGDPESLAQRMPALRTLRFVLLSLQGTYNKRVDLPFWPHRRCTLRPITPETIGPQTVSTRDQNVHPFWVPLCPMEPLTVDRATTANAEAEAPERVITREVCVPAEYCYSPSGDSRFFAAGERFPDSADPSAFATYHAGDCREDLIIDPLYGVLIRGGGGPDRKCEWFQERAYGELSDAQIKRRGASMYRQFD